MNTKGLVHIYCGDGKGKTTAAVGLSIRCAGGGGKVLFYQFLKDGSSSEINILKNIENIEVIDGYESAKFYNKMTDDEKIKSGIYYREKFNKIINMVKNKDYDLLVLDEIIYAVNLKYINSCDVVNFINLKPYGLEVVLTGRNPDDNIISCADYISEIKKIKHPFDNGIMARKLIES